MRKLKERMSERVAAVDALGAAGDDSWAARFGKRAMVAGLFLDAVEPILTVVGVILLASFPAMAQTGGTIFGQDQSMVPNAVRQTVIFAAGVAFLVGALSVIWGAFQYSRRQECMNSFIGGGLLMTIGGVISLISYLSSGRGVTVDRTLS
jgi:hypothetical protein